MDLFTEKDFEGMDELFEGKELKEDSSKESNPEPDKKTEESEKDVAKSESADSTKSDDVDVKAEKTAKMPYTPEEIRELLLSGDPSAIDTDRLSDEGKLNNKAFQAGYTPKFQRLAEEQRAVDAAKREIALKEQQLMQIVQELVKTQGKPDASKNVVDEDPDDEIIDPAVKNQIKNLRQEFSSKSSELEEIKKRNEELEKNQLMIAEAIRNEARAKEVQKIETFVGNLLTEAKLPNNQQFREEVINRAYTVAQNEYNNGIRPEDYNQYLGEKLRGALDSLTKSEWMVDVVMSNPKLLEKVNSALKKQKVPKESVPVVPSVGSSSLKESSDDVYKDVKSFEDLATALKNDPDIKNLGG